MTTADRVLGLFAKWPTPGEVKTRLAAPTSAQWAARVAEAFLRDSIARLSDVTARRVLAFAPASARDEFAPLVQGRFELEPQPDGDLGQRLSAFLRRRFDEGAGGVVLVGTDSPTLPLAYIEDAFVALESADVVLGPATDGGYYLLGCREPLPELFEGVDWSSERVLRQTVERLDRSRRLALLPPWYDVDRPEDWETLVGHLSALRRAGIDPLAPHTEALIAGGRE